jgi:superfamily II DNA/RNA helicase
MTFDDFNFHESLADSLYYMNFRQPTPVQEQAIPVIMEGRDLLATAQTGTGKTAAFMLPILNKLAENPTHGIDTLVIVPTRELAAQIDQEIQGFSYYVPASSIALYGGGDGGEFVDQRRAIENGVNIIVATPGKLISHLNMGYVNLKSLKHFILDEADRMLDMGFFDDIKKIINFLPEQRQNLLFSATMPSQMAKLSKQILKNAFEIKIAISKPAEGVKQLQYEIGENQKIQLLAHLISERPDYDSILIFSSTKKKVTEIENSLRRKKIESQGISSDLNQKEREDVLMKFKSKQTRILVATDVLSRGIDIKNINLVVNFDVPADAEDYVHRIGRTARAETKGEAITLVNRDDSYKMIRIERLIENQVEKGKLPIEIGNSTHSSEKEERRTSPSRNFKKGGNNNFRGNTNTRENRSH